ncbi:toxin-antitoxin system YwqK family antitoxin [Eudoraea chungangensis]|uniref:toxin-antitoxin system YwqK family antitoxin n=1 Tax=Eudoraea chungangensis TaxID=1481905 RepID=UPI0023EC085F|nr:nicotinic acid mononucleotide adenyltransferase [Eudoraea chungangensis]
MKKTAVLLALMLATVFVNAQDKRVQKLNKETNLIEVTDYHDNGLISQKGSFDLKGQLHGEWFSYDEAGTLISQGQYVNGVKSGKWVFWSNDTRKEVEYSENQIVKINGNDNLSRIADKN